MKKTARVKAAAEGQAQGRKGKRAKVEKAAARARARRTRRRERTEGGLGQSRSRRRACCGMAKTKKSQAADSSGREFWAAWIAAAEAQMTAARVIQSAARAGWNWGMSVQWR